ncbi:hypothetical protein V6N13_066708 [Hibiscus sabdariffa]
MHLSQCIIGHIAICKNGALACAESLKLTWTVHDPLAFCPGKRAHHCNYDARLFRSSGHGGAQDRNSVVGASGNNIYP